MTADIEGLLFWEHQWYFVFKGVRDGVPASKVSLLDFVEYPATKPEWKLSTLDEKRAKRLDEKKFIPAREIERPTVAIRSEPRVWQRLRNAESPEQVREACRVSRYWLRPKRKPFVEDLSDYSEDFLQAKKDSRYPASPRPSSEDKRLDYFARAMAGISLRMSPITAIDKLRKLRHPENCPCWRCGIEHEKVLKMRRSKARLRNP